MRASVFGVAFAESDNPQPRSTYYGHQSEIVCASVSAELGLVVSGSRDGACLIHTLAGELLQWLVIETPTGHSISNGHIELHTQSSSTSLTDGSSSAPVFSLLRRAIPPPITSTR